MLSIFLVALIAHVQLATPATTKQQILTELKNINETCKGEELCNADRHPKDLNTAKCGCDVDCAIYGDCCRDSDFFRASDSGETPFVCVPQPYGASFYMVAKCPANADRDLHHLCEKARPSPDPVANNLPVTVRAQTGLMMTYRNANCAKCNAAQLTAANVWTPFVQCYDNDVHDIPTGRDSKLKWNATTAGWAVVVNGTELYSHCDIDFRAPDELLDNLRVCRDGGFVDTCLPSWKNTFEERMCRAYTAFVVENSTSYRNIYCAKCNDKDVNKVDCIDLTQRSVGRITTFSNLLKVSDADRQECRNNEIYDTIFDKCRSIVCPPGRKNCPVNESTAPKNSNVSRIEYCSRVALEKGTFEILHQDNRTVRVDMYARNFTEGQYLVNNKGKLEICVEDVPEKVDGYSFAMGIVSVVGLGLSIFFLVLHLCAVALVPELRNHSGMNLSSLCVALLGAYISFIAGAFLSGGLPPRKSCAVVAVLTYYFFLSAFFWMLIIAFDVWRVLRGAIRHFRTSSGHQYCRFFAYSLFSWGVPAMLTVAAILIETAPPGRVDDRFRPRFGSESCWFSRRLSLIAFFATPLAVIMAVNVIFFVSSAFMVSTARLSSASSDLSGHKRDFRLYLRLAILLGLTWVVGLLAAVMNYEPLWICFVLFNTLQGLFIFAVFTCTSKVINGLIKPRPWLRGSLNLPPSKPANVITGSDVRLSQSTSETTMKSSGNSTTVEMSSQAQGSLPPSRKSSNHLEVTGLPQTLS